MTSRKKLPYKEGDWFAVPLTSGGYGLGLVARMNGKGVVLGYFFGPQYGRLPTKNDALGLSVKDAILVRQFGDPGLLMGDWPIIYESEHWQHDDWPLPAFARIAVDESQAWRVIYSEDDINRVISETVIQVDDARHLPDDSLSGSGALEIRLDKLLE